MFALGTVLGCSIEGTRQLGDTCLMQRECASPLRCEVTSDGNARCVTPTRLDVVLPDVSAVEDTGPADMGPVDTGPADTGPPDTGPADTGPPDTGPADTGQPDTGPADTGNDVVDATD